MEDDTCQHHVDPPLADDRVLHMSLLQTSVFSKPRNNSLMQQSIAPDPAYSLSVAESDPTSQLNKPLITLDQVHTLDDFQVAAQQRLPDEGYQYFRSGTSDEKTLGWNNEQFLQIELLPRILVDVSTVNTTCKLLGHHSSMPVFISPAAGAGYSHPDAEVGISRAAAHSDVIQSISTQATLSLEEITAARSPGQAQRCQLNAELNRTRTEEHIARMNAAGCSALLLTVDNPISDISRTHLKYYDGSPQPTAYGLTAIDATLTWNDLPWLQSLTDMPLVLKGVMNGKDAILAVEHGVDALIVSNHGARQLDHNRPTLSGLVEVVGALKEAGLSDKLEVYMDGGIRRGTDVYAALALGAKAVGIGRTPLFALAFGQAGVEKALKILHDEFETTMQLMGRTSLSQISAEDVIVSWP